MENAFNPDTSNGYQLSAKIMLSAIVILFAVVVFLIVLHVYARWYLQRARRRQRATRIVFYIDPNSPNPTTATRGLDVSLLNSLPVFSYSPQTHPESLECAVCLSEFEDNEKGRLLPKCQHSFHVDCIDMWFQSHSSCPLCRSPVEPVESPKENRSDVVLYVNETETQSEPSSSSGFCATCQHEGESGTTSLADRRKGGDLVGVTIEVPSRRDWENESAASLGFKSPATRLMSLKRILSFNRKTPASSPSSGVGTSSGSGSGESTQSRAQTPR